MLMNLQGKTKLKYYRSAPLQNRFLIKKVQNFQMF
jgi:hypothetical protein